MTAVSTYYKCLIYDAAQNYLSDKIPHVTFDRKYKYILLSIFKPLLTLVLQTK